jgi:prepilin-type N-terminal cleavage/methylation domain-containing protein
MRSPSTVNFSTARRRPGGHLPNAPFGRGEVVRGRSSRRRPAGGYTLIEVMVVIGLLASLMIAAAASVSSGKLMSQRLSDYSAALAVVSAKVEDIRAATYNPPNSPWGTTATTLTNTSSIALDQAGTTFTIPGTITSVITPVTNGHLVTVTGVFQTRRQSLTVTLQTVVNKFSAGQQ